MKCSVCDFDNREGARFCIQCGSRLEEPMILSLAVPTMLLLPPPEIETVAEPEALATELNSEPDGLLAQALAIGTLLKERYQILAVEQEGPPRVYEALDLLACGVCGQRDNPPGSTFCQECGAELGQVRVRLLEGDLVPGILGNNQEPNTTDGANRFEKIENEGQTVVTALAVESLLLPSAPSPVPVFSRGVRLECGQESQIGPRSVNQDSTVALVLSALVESKAQPAVALAIVADGMGGHQGGEIASRLAVQLIGNAVLQNLVFPLQVGRWRRDMAEGHELSTVDDSLVQRWLEAAIQDANLEIWHTGQASGKDMGTTLALAFALGARVYIANVGDSRTYMWGHDGLHQVSKDHSFVAELVASGHLAEEDSYSHPQRNLITRSLGNEPEVKVDFFQVELRPGESVLLCSDGLWEPLRNTGIQDGFLAQGSPQETAKLLVDNALLLGASDNISAVVLAANEW
ncbi:MAG: hypothetical protein EXR62_06760 [Chloroflexi bacterium]|nr:hypothetical protein [Chloroflexota bacterium]